MNKFDKLLSKGALAVIVIALVMLVFLMIGLNKTSKSVQETSAYTRASNCIVAKLAHAPVTQEGIELCYIQVERSTDIPLERFDMQTINNRGQKK